MRRRNTTESTNFQALLDWAATSTGDMSENVVEQEPVGEEAPKNIPIPENVDENESVIVSCGEIQGTFLVHKLKVIYDGQEVSPTKFENLGGRGSDKKWKSSLQVILDGKPAGSIGLWLQANYPEKLLTASGSVANGQSVEKRSRGRPAGSKARPVHSDLALRRDAMDVDGSHQQRNHIEAEGVVVGGVTMEQFMTLTPEVQLEFMRSQRHCQTLSILAQLNRGM